MAPQIRTIVGKAKRDSALRTRAPSTVATTSRVAARAALQAKPSPARRSTWPSIDSPLCGHSSDSAGASTATPNTLATSHLTAASGAADSGAKPATTRPATPKGRLASADAKPARAMSPPLARSIRRPGPRPRWRASVAPAHAPSTFAAIVKGMKTAGTSVPVSENTRSAAATRGHQRRPSNTSSTRLRAPGAQSSTTESVPTTKRLPNTPPAQ